MREGQSSDKLHLTKRFQKNLEQYAFISLSKSDCWQIIRVLFLTVAELLREKRTVIIPWYMKFYIHKKKRNGALKEEPVLFFGDNILTTFREGGNFFDIINKEAEEPETND